jgi:hypothetical protein
VPRGEEVHICEGIDVEAAGDLELGVVLVGYEGAAEGVAGLAIGDAAVEAVFCEAELGLVDGAALDYEGGGLVGGLAEEGGVVARGGLVCVVGRRAWGSGGLLGRGGGVGIILRRGAGLGGVAEEVAVALDDSGWRGGGGGVVGGGGGVAGLRGIGRGGLLGTGGGTADIEGGEGLGVKLACYVEALADLVALDGGVCLGAVVAIDLTVVEALVLEGLLDGLYLVIGAGGGGNGEDEDHEQDGKAHGMWDLFYRGWIQVNADLEEETGILSMTEEREAWVYEQTGFTGGRDFF